MFYISITTWLYNNTSNSHKAVQFFSSTLPFPTLFLFFFVCQNSDELSVHCFPLAGVNSAILYVHRLFETCRLRIHPNKSFLIEVYYTMSPCDPSLKGSSQSSSTYLVNAKEKKQIKNTQTHSPPAKWMSSYKNQHRIGCFNAILYNKLLLTVTQIHIRLTLDFCQSP